MHRYLVRILTALAAATGLLSAGAAPAQAAPAAVNMTFQVRPGPATADTPLTLSGRVWRNATGNSVKVYLYFRRNGASTWAAGGYVTADNGGYFTKRTTARVSGTWKAVVNASTARRGTLRTATSKVVKYVPDQIASYAATQAMWTSAEIRLPTREYRVVVKYTCADTTNENMGLVFGFGREPLLADAYDMVGSDRVSATMVMNGHYGQRTGYFQAYNAADCSFTAQVFAGTRAIMV